jgi:hypothetical protein
MCVTPTSFKSADWSGSVVLSQQKLTIVQQQQQQTCSRAATAASIALAANARFSCQLRTFG